MQRNVINLENAGQVKFPGSIVYPNRRLEQVLHVHPEKYQHPDRLGRSSSRHATPVEKDRSCSVEYTFDVQLSVSSLSDPAFLVVMVNDNIPGNGENRISGSHHVLAASKLTMRI
ncbi:hypothetical protein ANCCEY_08352 [Ancylostoma ceylanicum]|uniref:Uncharacterized protein n=1 Tax=Ancylostoma ceylanicum TaxID=53326 RepID=A0A0D6LY47_9BILA|nr:hypothetical protein ANCCEY_08352 [Ancylostoma ceylanicum]